MSPEGGILVRARIDHDLCTISLDTSGEPLHKRGYKEAVNPAPLRETMASLFLQQCGYDGREPVLDPMCGAGTFVIEAAEIAARLNPGRLRHFALMSDHQRMFDSEPTLVRTCEERETVVNITGKLSLKKQLCTPARST